MGRPPYRDGRVHVLSEKCDTCVFRGGNLMHLRAGRLAELVEVNLRNDSALTCHDTLLPKRDRAVCRGFFDAYWRDTAALRLAVHLDVVTFMPTPEKS